MNNLKLNLLAGGPLNSLPANLLNQNLESWIGIDRGGMELIDHDIKPLAVVGDFDSVNDKEMARIKEKVADVRFAPSAKDFTDTEFGIRTAIDYNPSEITIYGATNGRLDHLLANIFGVLKPSLRSYLPKINFVDLDNYVRYFLPGKYEIPAIDGYKYISFVNLTPIENLNIFDAKYKLENYSGDLPVSFSSNEFKYNKINFAFMKGLVAVIYSRDEENA